MGSAYLKCSILMTIPGKFIAGHAVSTRGCGSLIKSVDVGGEYATLVRRQLSPSAGDSSASLASVAEDSEGEETPQQRRHSNMERKDTGQIVDEIMGHVIGSPPGPSTNGSHHHNT